ncbi:head-tail joining protein [Lactococcus phage proPhi6]|nr:head-tail joining protein [Lactococcus phage proPhi6]
MKLTSNSGDYIEFDNKKWALMTYRNPSERNTFILQEVNQ